MEVISNLSFLAIKHLFYIYYLTVIYAWCTKRLICCIAWMIFVFSFYVYFISIKCSFTCRWCNSQHHPRKFGFKFWDDWWIGTGKPGIFQTKCRRYVIFFWSSTIHVDLSRSIEFSKMISNFQRFVICFAWPSYYY